MIRVRFVAADGTEGREVEAEDGAVLL